MSSLSGEDGLSSSLVREVLSFLSTDGRFLPSLHGGEVFSHLNDSLVSLLLLDFSSKLSLDLLGFMVNELLDGVLHSSMHLNSELLLESSSLNLESPVSVGTDLKFQSRHFSSDHLFEVNSSSFESVVSLVHDNSNLSEENLGTSGLSLHGVHSSSGS